MSWETDKDGAKELSIRFCKCIECKEGGVHEWLYKIMEYSHAHTFQVQW